MLIADSIFRFQARCVLPANLNLEHILIRAPINVRVYEKNHQKIRDWLVFFTSHFVRASQGNKYNKRGKVGNGVFSVCSEILQLYLTTYKDYVDWLLAHNVIEIVKEYQKGSHCTRFKFKTPFAGHKVKDYTILDEQIVAKIYAIRREKEATRKYPKLYDDLQNLTVDWEVADNILNNLYSREQYKKRELHEFALWRIGDPRMASFKLGNTKRLYTTISNIKTELRESLRYQGKPLIGLDLKNSIPFFSTGLFDLKVLTDQGLLKSIAKHNPKLEKHVENSINYIGKYVNFDRRFTRSAKIQASKHRRLFGSAEGVNVKSPPNRSIGGDVFIMLVDIAMDLDIFPDVKEYIELATTGKIYDILYRLWNEKLGTNHDRKSAKKMLLKIQNWPNFIESKEKTILEERFPNVMAAFKQLQVGFTKVKGGKRNAKWKYGDQISTFAYVMQEFEAHVILDKICGHIAKKKPGVPLFTIHDCIYTTEEHIDYLKEVMETKIYKILGRMPVIVRSDEGKVAKDEQNPQLEDHQLIEGSIAILSIE